MVILTPHFWNHLISKAYKILKVKLKASPFLFHFKLPS
jgi:hypothetical protein